MIFAAAEIKLKPHKTQVLLDTGGHTQIRSSLTRGEVFL